MSLWHCLTAWYKAARNIDQNRASNKAFQSTCHTPTCLSNLLHPPVQPTFQATQVHVRPTPGHSVPMDIDASWRRALITLMCYCCGKTGHKVPDCLLQFDIWALMIEELEVELETRLTRWDIVPAENCLSAPTMDFGVKICHPKWEKLLPKKFIITAMEENPTSLKVKVEIETTDTVEKKSITSLVNCRATGEFIDWHYAKSSCFNLVKLSQPIPVYNVGGTFNEAGSIMEAVNLILHYKNHSERTTFAVSSLGKQKLILEHSWLWKHNPEIDWITRCLDVPLDAAQKAESQQKDTCTAGPIPEIDHDFNSSNQDNSNVPLESLEEGDCILATSLLPLPSPTDIRASLTISQWLAEAFKANSKAESPEFWRS